MDWDEFVELSLVISRMSKDGWVITIERGDLTFIHDNFGVRHFNDMYDCKEFFANLGYM